MTDGDHEGLVGLLAEAACLVSDNCGESKKRKTEFQACGSVSDDGKNAREVARKTRKAETMRVRYHRIKQAETAKRKVVDGKLIRAMECRIKYTSADDSNLAHFITKIANNKVLRYASMGKKFEERLNYSVMCEYQATRSYMGMNPTKTGREWHNSRQYAIHYHIVLSSKAKENKWIRLFTIKKSKIPNAGYGLFAAVPFQRGQIVGIFYGKKMPDDQSENDCTTYAIESVEHGFIDPMGGPSSRHPVYFGMHVANDPFWFGVPRGNAQKPVKQSHNIWVGEDLIVRASQDIEEDQELYLNYRNGLGTKAYVQCKCHGCSEAAEYE
jgi:hypothetical protein